ncbi:hypothetical protein JB92DRAFT_426653 [Gautieria morchelliformis]|nr:hypothetical protein JB92DRAFT_426653 [Gautieria morchelliformis]
MQAEEIFDIAEHDSASGRAVQDAVVIQQEPTPDIPAYSEAGEIPPKSNADLNADLKAEQAGTADDEPKESLDTYIPQVSHEVDQTSNKPQKPVEVEVRHAIEEPKVASVAEAVDQANDEPNKQLDAEAVDRTNDVSKESLGTSAYVVSHQLHFTALAPPRSLHPAEVDPVSAEPKETLGAEAGGGILSQVEPRSTEGFDQTSDVPKKPFVADAPQDVNQLVMSHEYRVGRPLESSEDISSPVTGPDVSERPVDVPVSTGGADVSNETKPEGYESSTPDNDGLAPGSLQVLVSSDTSHADNEMLKAELTNTGNHDTRPDGLDETMDPGTDAGKPSISPRVLASDDAQPPGPGFIEDLAENITDDRDTKMDYIETSDTTSAYDQSDILISQTEELPEVHEDLLRTEPHPELPQTADKTQIHDVKAPLAPVQCEESVMEDTIYNSTTPVAGKKLSNLSDVSSSTGPSTHINDAFTSRLQDETETFSHVDLGQETFAEKDIASDINIASPPRDGAEQSNSVQNPNEDVSIVFGRLQTKIVTRLIKSYHHNPNT